MRACGTEYLLLGEQAKLWLAGRFNVAFLQSVAKHADIQKLHLMGLIEITEPDERANYRLLTNCVICMVKSSASVFRLNKNERRIWIWIKHAGFKLTISELVFIMDRGIKADISFFGKDNWHTLIHAIYTPKYF